MQSNPIQENQLKETIVSLKDVGIDYLKSKSELAAIESREAVSFAKKKLMMVLMAIFFGFFTYSILLILVHSVILQSCGSLLSKIQTQISLSEGQIVLLMMFLFHLFFLIISLVKLSKKSEDELFALTKSEFKKDQVWLNKMNNNAN